MRVPKLSVEFVECHFNELFPMPVTDHVSDREAENPDGDQHENQHDYALNAFAMRDGLMACKMKEWVSLLSCVYTILKSAL